MRWQSRRLESHLRWLLAHSPYTAERLRGRPSLDGVAAIEKRDMLQHFDRLVSAPIHRDAAFALAERAERDRDFAPRLEANDRSYTVGLSSGTSGERTLFVASDDERAEWAGNLLARMRLSLRTPVRVALLLRSGSNLYESVGSSRIQFGYFDFVANPCFEDELARFDPQVLVGPPSRLRGLADAQGRGDIGLAPKRVVSVAEVLEADDDSAIADAWGQPVEEIYQASEGFLAYTCARGTMHFDEDVIRVEREELGDGRFNPIITDMRRRTQPIVRYRLGDVIVPGGPCACGSPHQSIAAIEGRSADLVARPDGTVVYPDELRRVFLLHGEIRDHRLLQLEDGSVQVDVVGSAEALRPALETLLDRPLEITELPKLPELPLADKQRRIRSALTRHQRPPTTTEVASHESSDLHPFFDQIVYSSANEDGASERRALQLDRDDTALCVLGSGARAFELLIDAPGRIVAVDLNPHQCALAALKVAAYRALDHGAMLAFLGVRRDAHRIALYKRALRPQLDANTRRYWDEHIAAIDAGVIYSGVWERNFRWFAGAAALKADARDKLFAARSIDEQVEVWRKHWNDRWWRLGLYAFGRRATWRHVLKEPGIERIDEHMDISAYFGELFERCVRQHLFRENPYLHLLLRGRYSEQGPWPDHLQERHHARIRENLGRLELVNASVSEYLEANETEFTAFSISDVASYASPEEHARIWRAMKRRAAPGARVCERIFLADGSDERPGFQRNAALEYELEASDHAFIYRFVCGRFE